LRFILRFLLTVTNTQRTHTSAGESRGLRLAACLHPRALRASTPGSSARGRAQRQRTSRFLGADSHSKDASSPWATTRCGAGPAGFQPLSLSLSRSLALSRSLSLSLALSLALSLSRALSLSLSCLLARSLSFSDAGHSAKERDAHDSSGQGQASKEVPKRPEDVDEKDSDAKGRRFVYVLACVCLYAYASVHIHVNTRTSVCLRPCLPVFICICTCIYRGPYSYVYAYVYTDRHTHTHLCVCVRRGWRKGRVNADNGMHTYIYICIVYIICLCIHRCMYIYRETYHSHQRPCSV